MNISCHSSKKKVNRLPGLGEIEMKSGNIVDAAFEIYLLGHIVSFRKTLFPTSFFCIMFTFGIFLVLLKSDIVNLLCNFFGFLFR
jgi:hypothetical protein